jgi:hypothetical protein
MKPSLIQIWAYKLDTTQAGRIWDLTDSLLTIIFCFIYFGRTYNIIKPGDHAIQESSHLYVADTVVTVLIVIQWLPRVLFARTLFKRIFSAFGLSTLFACTPVILAATCNIFGHNVRETFYGHAGVFVYFYPLRFYRLYVSVSRCLVPAQQGLLQLSLIVRKVWSTQTNKIGLIIYLDRV